MGYFTERNYTGNLPYTDIAVERHRVDTTLPGVEYTKKKIATGTYERIRISTKIGAESIGKPMGLYDTLTFKRFDLMDNDEILDSADELAATLDRMLEDSDIFPGRLLIACLGNSRLTSDSVGPTTAKEIKPTMHIKDMNRRLFESLRCAEIAIIQPGVMATSGLDAAVIAKGVCDLIQPDAVIAIDSLCSASHERLGRTIQICNSGISPGSGIGNARLSLGEETLGVPVISIGVPTVIDSRSIIENNSSLPEPMLVSPKEINEIISICAKIIGGGINRAFGIY